MSLIQRLVAGDMHENTRHPVTELSRRWLGIGTTMGARRPLNHCSITLFLYMLLLKLKQLNGIKAHGLIYRPSRRLLINSQSVLLLNVAFLSLASPTACI